MRGARLAHILEVPALIITPCVLGMAAYFQWEQAALLTVLVALVSLGVMFASYETARPGLQTIMPIVVLTALAVAGRILFAAIPDVKPVSAICIIAGVVFGRRSGFMVGALTALISNFFFGQGMWTPWQMYSWGLIGWLAGVLESCGVFSLAFFSTSTKAAHLVCSSNVTHTTKASDMACERVSAKPQSLKKANTLLLVYGFIACLLYGFILNSWYVVGFLHPITLPGALAVYAAGLPFDVIHGIATVVFLLLLYVPWQRKLVRIRSKYALLSNM